MPNNLTPEHKQQFPVGASIEHLVQGYDYGPSARWIAATVVGYSPKRIKIAFQLNSGRILERFATPSTIRVLSAARAGEELPND
jgi:hypothetical protein